MARKYPLMIKVSRRAVWYYHKLKQTKTGLMQDLLTGKVQMKVDEEDGSA